MFELWKIHSPRTRNTDDVSVAVKVIEVVKVRRPRSSTRSIRAM